MEIIKNKLFPFEEHIPNKESFIQDIVSRIAYLIKEDNDFHLIKDRTKKLELLQIDLGKKNVKYDKILEQAENLKKGLEEKISDIDSKNFALKSSLLEKLGSEL